MDPQILQNYLEDNKYEEKFNIDKKFSFIYSLICIADKIMKNKLPYKMNTSNLIIITKDNNEYLKDNFDDLEIEIIKKNWLTIYPFWFINNNNKYIIRGKYIRRKDK